MPYQFETERQDLTDFAAGRVFYALPGRPAFPVRLAAEVFQRCLALRARAGGSGPVTLYDPCCGGAYHLAALGFLFPRRIAHIAASDIDPDAVGLAARNLALLNHAGLDQRERELRALKEQFGKASHSGALASLARLRARREGLETPFRVFAADAGDPNALLDGLGQAALSPPLRADLVFSDVPYGRHSQWAGPNPDPLAAMLDALRGVLSPGGMLAVALDKAQKPAHPAYQKVGGMKLGLRQVAILELISEGS